MPSLEEIIEQGAASAERMMRESMAIDYAWMTGNLDEFVDRKYAQLMGELDGGSAGGGNPGADPQA